MSVPSVSVIVPVYNGERFVAECLDSIARQRLEDIEIIIVDDGSIDSTAAICSDFVAAEPRARLVQKRNGGVSAARNSGLDIARGEYIAFIDAEKDDYRSHFITVFPLVHSGGLIVADNVLSHDISDYQAMVRERADCETFTLPLERGLEMTLKLR